MKTISLDIHDPSVLHSGLDLLLQIKEHYPKFKVSLFWIPLDPKYEMSQLRLQREDAVKRIKANLDWIELIPHGLTHIPREFEKCDYFTMRDLIFQAIDEAFKKDDLPYVKGFCAPYWLWSEGVVQALNEEGWFGAIDKNQPDMLKTKKFYTYSHSIDERFWNSTNDVLKLHGHLDGVSSNDLEKCLLNLLKMPTDAEFKFVSEMVEEK